jgi:hypothetical protein
MGQKIYISLKLRNDPELRFELEKKLAKELAKISKKSPSNGNGELLFGNTAIPFSYDFMKLQGSIIYKNITYPFTIIIP